MGGTDLTVDERQGWAGATIPSTAPGQADTKDLAALKAILEPDDHTPLEET
jgi:hypothetical protein